MTLKYIETHLLAFRVSLLLLTFYIRAVKLMLSILKTVSSMKQRTSSESSKRQNASEIQRVILHPLIVAPGLPPFNCGWLYRHEYFDINTSTQSFRIGRHVLLYFRLFHT